MTRKAIKIGVLTLYVSVVLVLAAAIFAGYLVWKLGREPIDLGFAREAIEAGLYDAETGHSIKLEKVVLYWPDYAGPLLLGLEKAKLIGKDGQVVFSVDEAAMSFSRSALLIGKLKPKSIVLKKPQLRVERGLNGEFDIGFSAGDQAAANNHNDEDIMTRILGYLARPGHEAAKNSIISRLEAFEINDARVLIDDKKSASVWTLPHFTAGFYSTHDGLQARFAASMDDIGEKPSAMTMTMDYFWKTKTSSISADLENIDIRKLRGKTHETDLLDQQNVVFSAHLDAALDANFLLSKLSFSLKSPQGTIYYPDYAMQPVSYKELSAQAVYLPATRTLIIDNTNITLGELTLMAKGDIRQEVDGRIHGPVRIEIPDVAQSAIGPLWPLALKGENAEKWIVERMSNGRFQDVWVGLELSATPSTVDTGWVFDAQKIQAGFAFKDMDISYRPPLWPVTKANGSGTFDLGKDEMKISVKSAAIDKVDVKKAELVFDRLIEKGVGDVNMDLELSGSLQSAIKYLAEEPVHLNKNLKMDLDKIKGETDAKLHISFPAHADVKMNEFKVSGAGTLNEYSLPGVVKTLDLSGKKTEFELKDGLFTLRGDAALGGEAATLEYSEYLNNEGKDFKSKAKASIYASRKLREKLGIELSAFLDGDILVDVDYTSLADGKSTAKVKADLTPGLFFLDSFDFEKPVGARGEATFTAHLKDKILNKITDLKAKGDNFSLSETKIDFIQKGEETLLSGGRIGAFTLGKTSAKLDFEIDKNRVAKIVMSASMLDARPFLDVEETKGVYQSLPMMISVTAARMQTAEKEMVKAAQIFIDMDAKGRFNRMEMDGIAGASAVYLRFSPDETGRRTFRLKTDDAGAALRSFQIYSNIRGGKMVIYAEPVEGGLDRNLIGKAEISDFKAVKAPILTRLLGLISVPGLLEVLSSDGLHFSKLEVDFNWVYRKGGSTLVLKEGRTSGNSLGLTFDGTVDNAQRKMDIKGTVVPMSEINNLVGHIPLVGDILTGGSGGIFAATYGIDGSFDNPDISVNPLSVLTPGILRRILFE